MTRVVQLVFGLLCLLGSVSTSGAQVQRMAIPSGAIELLAKAAQVIEAFCVDPYRLPPEGGTHYSSIVTPAADARVRLGTGPWMSLEEATKPRSGYPRGYLSIEGIEDRFDALRIVNNTGKRVRIERRSPVAFGEKHEPIDPKIWNPIKATLKTYRSQKPSPKGTDIVHMRHQIDVIWPIAAVPDDLRVLGYDGPRAIRAFQREQGIAPTGVLDDRTTSLIHKAVGQFDEELIRVGFEDHDPATAVRRYQRYHGLPETGRVDAELRSHIRQDRTYLRQVQSVLTGNRTASEYFRSPDRAADVLAFHGGDDSGFVLVRTPRGPELWESLDGDIIARYRNESAIDHLDAITRAEVEIHSDERIEFVHASASNVDKSSIRVQIGRRAVDITQEEMSTLLTGQASPRALDDAFAAATGGERRKFIVYRDAFARGSGGDGGAPPPDDAGPSPGHPDNFYHPKRKHTDPIRLFIALKKRYGDKCDFYLDDEMENGRDHALGLPLVTGGSDVAAYVNTLDPLVRDYKVIPNIESALKRAGIDVIKDGSRTDRHNILVITGHKNQAFRDYVHDLAERGVFSDRVVVLASCFHYGDPAFNSAVINMQAAGAKAILFFSEELDPQAVQDVLVEFSKLLADQTQSGKTVEELLNMSVDRAIMNPDNPADLHPQYEKMRRGILQTSEVPDTGAPASG